MPDKLNTTEFDPQQYPYRIRNWRKFQHYKYRNPPWIKLHFEILSSEDWVVLDDASKLLAVVIILIASKHDGHIPISVTPAYLRRVAYLEKTPNLKPLIECGFLVETLADASKVEHMLPNADTETETETETEKKVSKREASPSEPLSVVKGTSEKKQGCRLPEDWYPNAKGMALAVSKFGEAGAQEEYEDFRDYWLALPGARGRKLDWDRTWMKWCRNSRRNTNNGFTRSKSEKEKYSELLQSLGSGEVRSDITSVVSKLYPD